MKLNLSPDEEDFQRAIIKFVDQAFPLAARGNPSPADEAHWHQAISNEGWTAVEWPLEFGGPGWSPVQIYLWYRITLQANCPLADYCGTQLVGPLLQQFGGGSDYSQHLRGIIEHTHVWGNAVFFDASATLVATGSSESFLLTGKTPCFSTSAKFDRALVLAETSGGYSLFLVDLNLAGVTRTQAKFAADFFSLTLDQVRVSDLLGERDKGIDQLISLMKGPESVSMVVHLQVALSNLKKSVVLNGLQASMEKKLSELEIEFKALEATGLRSILSDSAEKLPIITTRGHSLARRISDIFRDVKGYYALPDEVAVAGGNEPPLSAPDLDAGFRQLEYLPGRPQGFSEDLLAKTLLGL